MRLSKRAEYGLVAAASLAALNASGCRYVRSKQIAENEGLPAKFLESILLALKSSGLLDSKVGAGGGYRFVRDPSTISVTELLRILEPATQQPVDQAAAAASNDGTPGHEALSLLRARVDFALESAVGPLTLADLVAMERSADLERAASTFEHRGEGSVVEQPAQAPARRAESGDMMG